MFECVQICTVSDTLNALQRPPPVRSTRRGLSGIGCRRVQRVQRPGVCRALHGLPWYLPRPGSGTACPAACDVQAVRVRWGLGSPPAGYIGSAGGGAGHARDKIFQRKRRFSGVVLPTHTPTSTKRNLSDCASLQKFQKIQKDPFRSLDCGIIS